jgi:fermentation-respiration switch protein FrsA (DUF1100 family)
VRFQKAPHALNRPACGASGGGESTDTSQQIALVTKPEIDKNSNAAILVEFPRFMATSGCCKTNPLARRWIIRLVRIAVLAYIGVMVFVGFAQTHFIFPGAATQGQKDALLFPSHRYELLSLRAADGKKITALFGKALQADGTEMDDISGAPTVLYFYGNGACLAYSTDVFDAFRRLGANVIIPDYEGYGMSEGKAGEAGCYAAADAAYDFLLTRNDIDHGKFICSGWSLGAAVAIDLAQRRPAAGLLLVNSFTSMVDMAHRFFSWLPVSLMLRHRFENLDKISRISCPILIVHSAEDEMIPPQMSDRLAAAAGGKVTRFTVEGGGHNDVFDVGGQGLLDKIKEWMDGI